MSHHIPANCNPIYHISFMDMATFNAHIFQQTKKIPSHLNDPRFYQLRGSEFVIEGDFLFFLFSF